MILFHTLKQVNNGNVEPFRGFGHIAMMTPDVNVACADLEKQGVSFHKKPHEGILIMQLSLSLSGIHQYNIFVVTFCCLSGKMKHIAFALDPDRYWIEIIPRGTPNPSDGSPNLAPTASIKPSPFEKVSHLESYKYTFAQTMFRIKDPKQSLKFYCDILGMTLLYISHKSDFSLYFLTCVTDPEEKKFIEALDKTSPEAHEYMKKIFSPVIELTHNHGTENNSEFKYHNGNDQDQGQLRGFGHTGFLVDDLTSTCVYLEQQGVSFKKKPTDGNMKDIAFVYDPDNYWYVHYY